MSTKDKNGFSWNFVSINFVKKDREALAKIDADPARVTTHIGSLAQLGYKCTVSFDQKTDCFVLAVTGKDTKGPDDNKTFSLYHSQMDSLWRGFVYIVEQAGQADSFSRLYDVKYQNDW